MTTPKPFPPRKHLKSARSRDRHEQALLDAWKHPIGTAVELQRDNGAIEQRVTRSEPQLLGGTAVIWLEGIPAAYALDRVRLLEVPDAR